MKLTDILTLEQEEEYYIVEDDHTLSIWHNGTLRDTLVATFAASGATKGSIREAVEQHKKAR